MGPRQAALGRHGLRSVAALTGAKHSRNRAGREIDAADRVVLGIGDVQRALRCISEALRTTQLRGHRRTAIAAVSRLAGAGDTVERLCRSIDAENGVSFAKRQIEITVRRRLERPRTIVQSTVDRRALGSGFDLAGPGVGFDNSGIEVQPPDAMVADVADE